MAGKVTHHQHLNVKKTATSRVANIGKLSAGTTHSIRSG